MKTFRFKMSMATLEIAIVQGSFKSLPGVTDNSQHLQLRDHILVEIEVGERRELTFKLFHPETDASAGHVDMYYRPKRHDGREGIEIRRYQHHEEVDFRESSTWQHCWPTGPWHLLMTIDALEKYLSGNLWQNTGTGGDVPYEFYEPALREWMTRNFIPSAHPVAVEA